MRTNSTLAAHNPPLTPLARRRWNSLEPGRRLYNTFFSWHDHRNPRPNPDQEPYIPTPPLPGNKKSVRKSREKAKLV